MLIAVPTKISKAFSTNDVDTATKLAGAARNWVARESLRRGGVCGPPSRHLRSEVVVGGRSVSTDGYVVSLSRSLHPSERIVVRHQIDEIPGSADQLDGFDAVAERGRRTQARRRSP
jgi:hypothetical protein